MAGIVILVLVLGYTNAYLEGRYRCFEKLRLINHTAVGLHSIPHSKSTLDNFTSILLSDNYSLRLFKGKGLREAINFKKDWPHQDSNLESLDPLPSALSIGHSAISFSLSIFYWLHLFVDSWRHFLISMRPVPGPLLRLDRQLSIKNGSRFC